MAKDHTSACVIIPPEEIWQPIEKIRRKHDRRVDRWMPHITLMFPFRHRSEYPSLEREFTETCQRIEAFPITLNEFGFFRHRYQTYTIWLDPQPNDPIVHLQGELLRITPDCNDVNNFRGGYQPHLSLGQFTTYKIDRYINRFKKKWDKLSFFVDEIYFINRKNTKNSRFKIEKAIPLKR
jgi:2'-5' RNA ligase